MQQCQHEKSQFCTPPGSPANHEGARKANPGNWKMKAKIFFRASHELKLITATRCLRHRAIPVPWQLQYPGYATEASLANKSLTTCASVAEGWTTCREFWQLPYMQQIIHLETTPAVYTHFLIQFQNGFNHILRWVHRFTIRIRAFTQIWFSLRWQASDLRWQASDFGINDLSFKKKHCPFMNRNQIWSFSYFMVSTTYIPSLEVLEHLTTSHSQHLYNLLICLAHKLLQLIFYHSKMIPNWRGLYVQFTSVHFEIGV